MLEVHDVCFSFDGKKSVLEHVSLAVEPGERVVLLGPNGSGKSTLARLLNGSLAPSSGCVHVDGRTEGLARLVGYVRQDPRNQIVSAVVSDEVAFGPRNLGLPRAEVLGRVDEALEACGIPGLRDRMTSELSGGQQQLVAIAGVLAMRPRYLVLDEATSMLDPMSRERVAHIMERLVASGLGVLEISHRRQTGAREICLERGRISYQLPVSTEPPQNKVPRSARLERRQQGLCVSDVSVLGRLRTVSQDFQGLVLVTGPSGAGKTTLARVLTGVLAPDSGEVTLDGRRVRPGDVGLAFQRPEDQLFCDTVLDDIAYGPRAQGLAEEEALAAARAAAARLGIGEELLDRSPFALSGGQMRRVALAGVIAARPRAYVFDEPTAGLDARGIREFRDLACGLADEGATVVVITHDPEEWDGVADASVELAPAEPCLPVSRARVPGAYAPGSTVMHELDPRAKLVLLLMATVATFAASAPWGLLAATLGLVAALVASRTSPATIARGLRPAAMVLALSVLSNAVVLVGQPGFSPEGLTRSVAVVCRIALVVGFALSFSSTTPPPAIADALAALMAPLRRLGVPVGAIAMSSSIALRFIPLAAEEVDRIRCAQRARGARLDEGGLVARLRSWAQVLVPLVVGLFRRADELAAAMVDRCYTGEQTALLAPLARRDWEVLALGALWSVAAVAL